MKEKITLPVLINLLTEASGQTKKQCEDFLRELFALIAESVSNNESVKIKGLGTFKVTAVEARKSVNVNTGEEMEIPSHRKLTFAPARELAEIVNAPFEIFEQSYPVTDNIPLTDAIDEQIDSDEDSFDIEVMPANITNSEIEQERASQAEPELDPIIEHKLNEGSDIINETETGAYIIEEEIQKEEAVVANEIAPKPEEEEYFEPTEDDEPEFEPEPKVEVEVKTDVTPDVETETESDVNTETESNEDTETESNDDTESELESATEQELEYEYNYEQEYEPKRSYKFLWGFLSGIGLAALLAVIGYILVAQGYININLSSKSTNNSVAVTAPVQQATDTIPETQPKTDSIKSKAEATKQLTSEKNQTENQDVNTKPSDVIYDTISTTRYLTTMAKAHYGNYNLWPYIYEENNANLGHPDRIKPGTKVVIPKLSKYGVDPKNPEHVRKAKQMGIEIYARYK